ncbi:hypothetical protein BaRGS_00013611 [Batillaria attramentaria]|uniref:Uncharacterized protein n=1 Tax=Batillaria attramentaria TaxID=370345 RepID=A0ABD0L7G5_9CAEN
MQITSLPKAVLHGTVAPDKDPGYGCRVLSPRVLTLEKKRIDPSHKTEKGLSVLSGRRERQRIGTVILSRGQRQVYRRHGGIQLLLSAEPQLRAFVEILGYSTRQRTTVLG